MELKDITLIIDGKMHKLINDRIVTCSNCSLYKFCDGRLAACPATVLGGDSFVELKVEK